MAQYTCWSCGTGYDGANCPVCILRKQSERNADQATRDQERATAATERALEEQTREITAAFERENEAAEQRAYEMQMAIERATEENRKTKADEWKLQSRSKSAQAAKLMDSGMLSEAMDLASQAIEQDRGNLDGYVVAVDVLNEQGRYDAAKPYLEKLIQLLSHSDYRTDSVNFLTVSSRVGFLTVSSRVGSDGELMDKVCKAIEGNIEFWDWRGARVDEWVHTFSAALSAWKRFGTVLVVQRWLLRNSGFTGQRLTSARKLVLAAAGSPAGVEPLRGELEELAQWISGEDKRDDSKMSQSAGRRRPLAALVLAEEIYALLGTKKRLIPGFLQKLDIADREKLEEDLGELRGLSAREDFSADAFSRVQHEVAEKYSAWKQKVQEQVYSKVETEVNSKPITTHGFLAGLVAYFILAVVAGFSPLLFGHGFILRTPTPTTAFGSLLGAILSGVALKKVERSFRYHHAMRDALDGTVTRTNQRIHGLGLPTIPTPALKVHPPRLSILVYAVLLCSYLGCWLYAIAPLSAPNERARPSQGSVPDSEIQPNPSPTGGELQINGVSAILPQQMQTFTITGAGLGQESAYSGDSDFIQVSDLTRDWNAGWSKAPGTDKVGLNVTSWTDTKIVVEGFTGQYGGQWSLGEGDKIRFRVWSPQTGQGPAIYTSVVAGAATHSAVGPNAVPANGSETESRSLQESSPQSLVGQWNWSSCRDKFKYVMSITSQTPDGQFTGNLSSENGNIVGELKGDNIEFTRELTRFGGKEQRYTGKLAGTRPNLRMVMGTWSGAFEENGEGTDWHAEMIPR